MALSGEPSWPRHCMQQYVIQKHQHTERNIYAEVRLHNFYIHYSHQLDYNLH